MWGALISGVVQLAGSWMQSNGGESVQSNDLHQIFYSDLRMKRENESLALRMSAGNPDWIPLAIFGFVVVGALIVVGKS